MMQTDPLRARQDSFKKIQSAGGGTHRRGKMVNQLRKKKKDDAMDNRRGRFQRNNTPTSLESYNESDVAIAVRGFGILLAVAEPDAGLIKTKVEQLRQMSNTKDPSIIAQLKPCIPDLFALMAKINYFIETQYGQIQEKWELATIQKSVSWILFNIVDADPSALGLLATSDDYIICLVKALSHECLLLSNHYPLFGMLGKMCAENPSICEKHEQLLIGLIKNNKNYHARFTSAETSDVVAVVETMFWFMNVVASSLGRYGKLAKFLEYSAVFMVKNRYSALPNIGVPSESGILALAIDITSSLAEIKESRRSLIQDGVAEDLAHVLAWHDPKAISAALGCLDALFQDNMVANLDVVLRSVKLDQISSVLLEDGPEDQVKKKALAFVLSVAAYAPGRVIRHQALFGKLVLLAGADSGYSIRLNALGALRNVFLGASQQDLELDEQLAIGGFKALCDAIGDRTMQLTSVWKWTILKAIYQPLTKVGVTQLQLYKEELETSGAVEEIEHLQNDEGNVNVSDWSSKIYELVNPEADENDSPDTSGVAKTLFRSPLKFNRNVGKAFTSRKNY